MEVSELRNMILDAKSATESIEIEEDTSFKARGSKEASKVYQNLKNLNSQKSYNIDKQVGAGSGSRDKLDQLIKGMEYANKHCIQYEKIKKKI